MKPIHFFILIITCMFSTGCFCVKKLPQSKLNPTEYIFPISKKALTSSLIFPALKYKDCFFTYEKNIDYFNVSFTSGHIYKNYGGSYVYRKGDKGKPYWCNFGMQIDSLTSDSCRVRFTYIKGHLSTRIIKLGDMWVSKRKPIPSTTIEEYEMLRKIGKRLGVLDQMPLVNYPDGLTRDQIRMTYGHHQEFTYDEMFGEPQLEAEKDPVYSQEDIKKRKRKGLPSTKFDYSRYSSKLKI